MLLLGRPALGRPSLASGSSVPGSSTTTTTTPPAETAAGSFLARYVAGDGRVVRLDQGGDTASEGQAYALLLAVAVHNARLFDSVWTWERDNLQQPSGLFAYLWSNGAVAGAGAATDADLDTAWALVLGASAFGRPDYLNAGMAVASAILANETVVSGGLLELVAGPWARTVPSAVDPSYFSPEAMAALATASGDARWTQIANNSQQLLSDLEGGVSTTSLPPDWASLSASGVVAATPPPAGGKSSPSYGLDAQRVPVWFAADCTPSGRSLSAKEWPAISNLAASGSYLAYSLTGAVESPSATNWVSSPPPPWLTPPARSLRAGAVGRGPGCTLGIPITETHGWPWAPCSSPPICCLRVPQTQLPESRCGTPRGGSSRRQLRATPRAAVGADLCQLQWSVRVHELVILRFQPTVPAPGP